jgi:hypothetical protein
MRRSRLRRQPRRLPSRCRTSLHHLGRMRRRCLPRCLQRRADLLQRPLRHRLPGLQRHGHQVRATRRRPGMRRHPLPCRQHLPRLPQLYRYQPLRRRQLRLSQPAVQLHAAERRSILQRNILVRRLWRLLCSEERPRRSVHERRGVCERAVRGWGLLRERLRRGLPGAMRGGYRSLRSPPCSNAMRRGGRNLLLRRNRLGAVYRHSYLQWDGRLRSTNSSL